MLVIESLPTPPAFDRCRHRFTVNGPEKNGTARDGDERNGLVAEGWS